MSGYRRENDRGKEIGKEQDHVTKELRENDKNKRNKGREKWGRGTKSNEIKVWSSTLLLFNQAF